MLNSMFKTEKVTSALTPEQQAYLEMLSQEPQMQQMPEQTRPAWRTEDLIKLILGSGVSAAIGGNEGVANYLNSYMGSKEQKAQDDTVFARTKAQYDNESALNKRNTGLNVAKARMDITDTNRRRDEDAELKRELKAQDTENKNRDRLAKELAGATDLFNRAKTLPEMQVYAKKWADIERRMGSEVITAPTEEQVLAAHLQKSNTARNVIYDNWRQYVDSSKKDNYGMVLPAEAAKLMKLKKDFEAELATYGIADAYLPDPPTEKTKLAEYKADMLQLAKDKGVELKEMNDQRILESKARVQFNKDRLGILNRNAATSEKNAETTRLNHELRKDISQTNKAVQSKIEKITADINGLRNRQKLEASPSKRREIELKIQELDGRRQYWAGQKEPELPPSDPDKITTTSGFSTTMSDGTKISWKP